MIRVTIPKIGNIQFSNARLMRTIGQALIGRIRSRTQSGRDMYNRAFRPLSSGYARQKRKHLGHATADLQVSGRMLNDMQAKPRPDGVTISFISGGASSSGGTFIQRSRSVGAAQKAGYHNLTGAGKSRVKREFFGLSDEDENFILDSVTDFVSRQF